MITTLVDNNSGIMSIELINEENFENDSDKALLEIAGFSIKEESFALLHEKKRLCIPIKERNSETVRVAITTAIKTLLPTKYEAAFFAPENADEAYTAAITAHLVAYSFTRYKSEPKSVTFNTLSILNSDESFEHVINEAFIVAQSVNYTRDLVNTTPYDITPDALAMVAQELAKQSTLLSCNIYNEEALVHEKMMSMHAVGRGSINKPRLIHMSYIPKNPRKKVTLVGKGLTYDSGGLSLKPSTSMVTMKMDKAGACSVLGVVKAAAAMQLDIEINAFIGAAENMPSANAYKPDDVLTSRSGKTIEVRNTDAEGRLVLADVLTFAQDTAKEADYIFDYATLTGACMVALGQYTIGVMGHSDALKQEIATAATDCGELVGTLPFNKHLKKLLKSDIADISNIGSKPYGGAITAALFLDHFITDEMKEKWLHFDIAGVAYNESSWDVNPVGATGASVRTTLQWLKNL